MPTRKRPETGRRAKRGPARPGRRGRPRIGKRGLRRWTELTGEKLAAKHRVPQTLLTALDTLVAGRVRQGEEAEPSVEVFVRRRQGTGCDQVAEIAGIYSARIQGGACIGQAAVLAILNGAAERLCCSTLRCPERCPCRYLPRQVLAAYECTATEELGYLLQGDHVWNCMCFAT